MDSQHPHSPLLVQAPVRALDPDGTGIITAGTVAFALASLALWWRLDDHAPAGQAWWVWVWGTGGGGGGIGMGIAWTRSHRRKTAEAEEPEAAG